MKNKTLLLVSIALIYGYGEIYAQNFGPELLQHNNFGTTTDGVTGINTAVPLYPAISNTTVMNNYFQPPTRVFVNNATAVTNLSVNPAVTIAPPLNNPGQTQYTFGFNETAHSNLYQFITDPNATTPVNSGVQIPMAPAGGNYVIATSTQGMYNAPTASASWAIVYDRYETNTANPTNYFLIVNTGKNNSNIFYKQKVTVARGGVLKMSVDIARLNLIGSPPNIGFKIMPATTNGDVADNTALSSYANAYTTGNMTQGTGQWQTFTFNYVVPCTGGISTSADSIDIWIAFANVASGNGNNIALDNLSLKEILPQITTSFSGNCPNQVITLTAVMELATTSGYSFQWYKDGVAISPNGTGQSITASGAGTYYYTVIHTSGNITTACPLHSPSVTISADTSDNNCTIEVPEIEANSDVIQANPGTTVTRNIITGLDDQNNIYTGTDCNSMTGDCDPTNLQILQFTIPSNYGISAGTYTPGIPVVITDNLGTTIGVLTIASDGTLTFQEVPNYTGAVGAINFNYTIVDTQTGATASTTVNISLSSLNYTTQASCAGYPVRVVFDVQTYFATDFYYADGTTPLPAFPHLDNASSPFTAGTDYTAYSAYLNDALATRYYLVNGNTGEEFSDKTIINDVITKGTSTTKITVIRDANYTDGGKIIFDFIENTPGLQSYQLRKKAVYAEPVYHKPGDISGTPEDPIRRRFLVQICPLSATWTGQNSTGWQDNNNWISAGLGAYPIWCTDVTIPGPTSVLTTSEGDSTVILNNFPILIPGDACRDIVFNMGASVGRIMNLTYRAAYVQYQAPGFDNKWTMISAPLKYIYSADFQSDPSWSATTAFSDIKSYMSYFDVAYSDNVTPNPDGVPGTYLGNFSKPFANLKQELTAGFGFASNVVLTGNGGTTFTRDSTFYFPRFMPYGNAKYFQDLATHLREVLYKYHYTDNGEWVNSHPNPAFNPFTLPRGTVSSLSDTTDITGKMTDIAWNTHFCNTNTSYPNPLYTYTGASDMPNPLLGQDSRYRFIYEDANQYQYNASSGEFTVTLPATGTTRIVGNPFMSHLDFRLLVAGESNNFSQIQTSYYRIWDGVRFYTNPNPGTSPYDDSVWQGMTGLSTAPNDSVISFYIPPMQAFFVDVKDANSPLVLTFSNLMTTAQIPNNTNNNMLRSRPRSANDNLLRLRLKMNEIETVALLASLHGASDSYIPGEDIYKLFSYNPATPEIYTISDKTAIEINAVSQDGEQKLIPIGIKTNQTGQFQISIEGVANFNAYEYVYLRDALENINYDLRKNASFTFNKTLQENLEGRFYILLSSSGQIATETTVASDNQEILIVRESDGVRIYSSIDTIESFEVYDVSGRLLFKDTGINASVYFWTSKLEQGIYIVNVHAGKSKKAQKIKW